MVLRWTPIMSSGKSYGSPRTRTRIGGMDGTYEVSRVGVRVSGSDLEGE